MGFFQSLVDKMKNKQEELGKKAAKKAAEVAFDQGAKAAKGAFDSAGKAIEKALFGATEPPDAKKDEVEKPDPFAKVKADAKAAREVEAELAALKKKLGK